MAAVGLFTLRLAFGLVMLAVIYHLLTRKYLNPYKLTFVFGKKGSGKSTLLTKLALRHLKSGWSVFTTEHVPGTFQITYADIGIFEFPPHSAIFIDEASLGWDNRAYKSMPKSTIEWFRLQRHRKCKVYLFSQTFDVDKKIRDLSDAMFLVSCKFRVFSWGKRIVRRTVLVEASGDSPSRIDENLAFESLLLAPFGSRTFTFIPRYAPYFDSHSCVPLAPKDYERVPDLQLPRRKDRRRQRVASGRARLLRLLRTLHSCFRRCR